MNWYWQEGWELEDPEITKCHLPGAFIEILTESMQDWLMTGVNKLQSSKRVIREKFYPRRD